MTARSPANGTDPAINSTGLRALLYEGVCSQIMDTFTGGAFLVSFILLLGASNTMVGLLAAISPLTQLIQLPAIYLVDRTASRKSFVVFSSLFSRVFWLILAAIPWIAAPEHRLPVLFVCLFLYFGLSSVSACAFNPWMKDLVPQEIMGRYFGKRLAFSTAAGVFVAILAAAGLHFAVSSTPNQFVPYSVLFFLGAMSGLGGVYFLSRIPDQPRAGQEPLGAFEALVQPLQDANYRRLLIFLGTWVFAINLAGPFYAVYMIKQLGLSMALVVGLSVLSQIMSVMSFRFWGRVADSYSNKSVLFLSGHLYIVSVLFWPFLVLTQSHLVTISLLVIAHVVNGVSVAGVNLCTGNIALKAAPPGKSTAFLALKTLIHGVAAAIAPILAGVAADWLSQGQQLLSPCPLDQSPTVSGLLGFSFKGLHVLFLLTAIFCLYAMHSLRFVREDGEIGVRVLLSHLAMKLKYGIRKTSGDSCPQCLSTFAFRSYREDRSETRKSLRRQ